MFFPAASFGFDLGCALTPWGTDTMAYLNNIFPRWPWVDRYISLLRAIDCTIWKEKCRGVADCTIWKEKCRGAANFTIWKEKYRGAADCAIWKEMCRGAADCTIWKEKCRGAAILQKTGIHRFTQIHHKDLFWSTSFPIVHQWSVYCVRVLFFNLVCRWYKHVYSRQRYSRYVPQIEWGSN